MFVAAGKAAGSNASGKAEIREGAGRSNGIEVGAFVI